MGCPHWPSPAYPRVAFPGFVKNQQLGKRLRLEGIISNTPKLVLTSEQVPLGSSTFPFSSSMYNVLELFSYL